MAMCIPILSPCLLPHPYNPSYICPLNIYIRGLFGFLYSADDIIFLVYLFFYYRFILFWVCFTLLMIKVLQLWPYLNFFRYVCIPFFVFHSIDSCIGITYAVIGSICWIPYFYPDQPQMGSPSSGIYTCINHSYLC